MKCISLNFSFTVHFAKHSFLVSLLIWNLEFGVSSFLNYVFWEANEEQQSCGNIKRKQQDTNIVKYAVVEAI